MCSPTAVTLHTCIILLEDSGVILMSGGVSAKQSTAHMSAELTSELILM